MSDITMCLGKSVLKDEEGNYLTCPIRESCYRFKATPDEYQSYFIEMPIKILDNLPQEDYIGQMKGNQPDCPHYWELWEQAYD